MKRKFLAIGFAVVVLSISALAFAAVDGLSVRRQPKEGQVIKLRIKATLEIAGSQATFTGLVSDTTTKVDTDGSYTESEAQTEAEAKFGDQPVQVPNTGPYSVTYNADGSLKTITGDPATTSGPDAYRMSNLEVIIDSGKPLNVGDSWSADIKGDDKSGAVPAKADYKVLGEEKIGDVDSVKLKVTVKENQGAMPASSDGTFWLSKADGSVVKAEIKWVNAPFPGSAGPMNATMTETRE
jgi:hypothetical protein